MPPDQREEDRRAEADAISHEIARYLARHDCQNTDPTVDPIDLLRRVDALFKVYDEEIEEKDRLIEQLKAGH